MSPQRAPDKPLRYRTSRDLENGSLRGDNFSPQMPCQWYVRWRWRGQAADSDWSVRSPPPRVECHLDVLSCHLRSENYVLV
jgi:hypothetical protein